MNKTIKYCGAGLPDRDGDRPWHWCDLAPRHQGRHRALGVSWDDTASTEVLTLESVRAVPDHVHDFVGDEDTCVAMRSCPLTWYEFLGQKKRREALVYEGVPRDEHLLVDEIVRMTHAPVPYSKNSYGVVLAELVESVARRVRQEERESVTRMIAKLTDETDELLGNADCSENSGQIIGMQAVVEHLCKEFELVGFVWDGSVWNGVKWELVKETDAAP